MVRVQPYRTFDPPQTIEYIQVHKHHGHCATNPNAEEVSAQTYVSADLSIWTLQSTGMIITVNGFAAKGVANATRHQ